ncbi:MAG: SLAP domain-containing protein [Candidatus Lactobacillus pullistercoris]|mgnify:FL=1|uniref:SLAP domain-containing protein n=1 Tax=Candidatus Lactobacillus pullistercoris TaxID=2838636 RepID=A0A9E2NUP1_9LACO|nr:SLAP domain-containing protein [Candidatus Lactobacillus pullistercoris]
MQSKKILSILACAGILASAGVTIVDSNFTNQEVQTVKAVKVKARSYGIDVAVYQSTSLASSARKGAKYAIVKVSEGTSYRNPRAKSQISSAKANGMMPMAYHFALFGANSSRAKSEAKYAVLSAKAYGLPKGSYIACDWETGDGNNVNGGKTASANAIIAFMKQIKASGYQPLLYSGAYLLNSHINTSKVTNAFPNSLWVASYATMGRIDTPNFNYFPSMNGVAIWQFTDNWRGLHVDGNISLLPLTTNSGKASSQAPSAKGVTARKKIMSISSIYDKNGKNTGKHAKTYKTYNVYGTPVKIGNKEFYRIGKNSYVKLANVDGIKRVLKSSTKIFTNKGKVTSKSDVPAGTTVATYGGIKTVNGQKVYRVNKNRYMRADAF